MVLSGAGRALPAVLVPSQKAGKAHPTLLTLKYPGQGSIPGDGDGDDDVDLFDVAAYFDCVTGPGGGVPPNCETFDFDEDDDVDFTDLGAFQLAYTGA